MEKLILVTGGATGIGKAVVKDQANRGNNIVYTYHNRRLEEELNRKCTGTLEGVKVDIRCEDELNELIKMIKEKYGKLNGLVNCAGIPYGNMAAVTRKEDLMEVFEVNLFSQISITQKAVRIMRKSKQASIVNIASATAYRKDIGTLAYGSSKAALIYATKIMAEELIRFGIRVNAIAPSITNTKMIEKMDRKAIDKQIQESAMKRIAEPEEIASVVEFLLSSSSSYLTGQCIRVDGGLL